MRRHWVTRTIVALGTATWAFSGALASETVSGKWSMHRSETPGTVQFSLQGPARSVTNISDWPVNSFAGLDLAQDTQFTLTRDAGKFEFEGTLRDSAGAGTFQFTADPRYAQEMKALGFRGVEGKQVHFATHDVSSSFARDMKNANLKGLDTDKLLAFRIHGVSRKFIDELGAAGHDERDSNQLIAFRIHGVTPDFIGELRKLGFEHPQSEQLVNFRIHGVTPEYISQLQLRGVKNLTVDKLVDMKIYGLD